MALHRLCIVSADGSMNDPTNDPTNGSATALRRLYKRLYERLYERLYSGSTAALRRLYDGSTTALRRLYHRPYNRPYERLCIISTNGSATALQIALRIALRLAAQRLYEQFCNGSTALHRRYEWLSNGLGGAVHGALCRNCHVRI